MNHVALPFVLAAAWLAACGGATGATLIRDYAPERHDRFYAGGDRAFLGQGWDFSGIGRDAGGPWGTLVSDRYFLSATHYHPEAGSTLTFWETNSLNGPTRSYSVAGGLQIGTTDLWLGWLSEAADPALARYEIPLSTDPPGFVGWELVTYGVDHRVGRNIADAVESYVEGGSSAQTLWFDYDNNDSPSVGGDEAYLWYGDSGAPTFVLSGGKLALVGVHWSITDGGSGDYEGDSSVDSFVPAYILEINSGMAGLGEMLATTTIPEPGTLPTVLGCLLAAGGVAATRRCLRRGQRHRLE